MYLKKMTYNECGDMRSLLMLPEDRINLRSD